MAKARPRVVRLGEHLYDLAVEYGIDVEEIWSLPENQGLKDEGRTPEQLASGDVVYIPVVKRKFLSVQVGQKNRFVATLPTTKMTVKLQGDDHKGLANVAFEVPLLKLHGQTDGDGNIHLKEIPHGTKILHVHLLPQNITLKVRVGYLDPVTTASGKAQRLAHLGYLPDGEGVEEDELILAYDAFCTDHAPSATTDADKEGALSSAHGS